jgi:hypothetical protein
MAKFVSNRHEAPISAIGSRDETGNTPPPIEPVTIGLKDARRLTGLSRSALYRGLAAKQFMAIKSGTRTLILWDSLRQHLASLPPATFRSSNTSASTQRSRAARADGPRK